MRSLLSSLAGHCVVPGATVRRTGVRLRIPYYAQTSEFSCGPACLAMVTSYLDGGARPDRRLEFELWRSVNMIGVRGADPFGMSVPLLERGLDVRIITERAETFPVKRFRQFVTAQEASLAIFANHENRRRAVQGGARISFRAPRFEDVADGLDQGWIPIPLVHMGVVHRLDIPHWNVVVGIRYGPGNGWKRDDGDARVTIHDPYPPRGKAFLTLSRSRFEKAMDDIAGKMWSSRSLLLVHPRRPAGRGSAHLSGRARRGPSTR